MPNVPIRALGIAGVFTDIPGSELPPEAWTTARNVRFQDTGVVRAPGDAQVQGSPSVVPYYVFSAPAVSAAYWLYTDLVDVYAVVGGTHTKVTRVSGVYAGNIDKKWTGTWLGGAMALNNGVDLPQAWTPISAGTKLVDMPNWPAGTTCQVMRGFQNFLFALDLTVSSVRYPTTVRWSHPADPGQMPVSWDIADATRLAGEVSLSDTPGYLVDGLTLGRSFLVFKEDAIVRFDRVQNTLVFAQTWLSTQTGLLGVDCAKVYSPGKAVLLTRDADVVVTEGQQVQSITDGRVRRKLEETIDGTYRTRSFVVVDEFNREVLICYPTVGNSYCTEAAVWNWRYNTWSFRDISPTLCIQSGIYDESAVGDAWSSNSDPWDSASTAWDQRNYALKIPKLIGAYPTLNQLRQVNVGLDREGTADVAVLERTGLAVAGQDRQGNPKVDVKAVKVVTEVHPIVETSEDMTLQVSVGAADSASGPIAWEGPYSFNPATDEKVDCYTEGRYIAVRFSSEDPVNWTMSGYVLNVDLAGEMF